ncbi:MAG: sulfite exporter TauE/SafE family protein [Rhodothermales bacterium]
MEIAQLVTLVGAGLAAGFIAGLLGVGGGVLFAPVLFFYFEHIGIDPLAITPLTLGTSLFCTLVASLVSGYFHFKKGAVVLPVALKTGLLSAVTVILMTRFVTTKSWYDGDVFQIVFGTLLLVVAGRMIKQTLDQRNAATPAPSEADQPVRDAPWSKLVGISALVGVVATAAGVGGGVVMVPAYSNMLKLPIKTAIGTSSATIILIAILSSVTYIVAGLGAPVPDSAIGYVDFGHALALVIPAIFTARLGVGAAHRMDTRRLRWAFAGLAVIISIRLFLRAIG